MANFLSAVSEFLFKDANILIQIRDWFFAQAGNILLALILFWIGRYAIKWVKAFAVRGHVIQVGDVVGSVKSIQFMYTVITTKDQKNVYIPNSLLTSQAVTNIVYTTERVIPFTFDIGYNNDHHEAIKILKNIFAADKRVLNPKNMEIGISEFGDNSVRIAAYARVKSNDFLDVQYSIMSDVKDAFDKYGIDIPYPQRVVYIQNVDTSTGEIKGTKKKATTTNVALDDSLES
ncbi:MAG: mechanosensitive ion channel family protein [Veillonella sp.]|nr:mechanosensitive ion channel family protein [Veillonella sp.]